MKVYQSTTIQYLDAATSGGAAGWYAIQADMAPTQEGAIMSLSELGDGLADADVILNAAASDVARPAAFTDISVNYVIEADFAPTASYQFNGAQAEDIYNSVNFSDDMTLTMATVTEYVSGQTVSHIGLTLTFQADGGHEFDISFDYAMSHFSFSFGTDIATDLNTFIDSLSSDVETASIMKGTEAFDIINGDDDDNQIDGVGGIDTIHGKGGNDTISLEKGTAYGGEGDDTITVNAESDTGVSLYGNEGDDTLVGASGDDNLTGGAGADHLDGGAGADMAYYSGSEEGVSVNLATGKGSGGDATGDTLANIERVSGSDHDDNFTGDEHDNLFMGGKGDDTFISSGGNDSYYGGRGGDDTVDYSAASSGITVDLDDYTSAVVTMQDGDVNIVRDIEHVTGTAFDDEISGTRNNNPTANHGNNTLKGMGGNDILRGEAGDDVLDGGTGDDVLIGGQGADKLIGGTGTDTASYEGTTGVIVDLADTSKNTNDAAGDSYESIEIIKGSASSDSLNGSEGDDVLIGNGGTDILNGRGGDDTLTLSAGFANGGEGDDTITVNGSSGHSANVSGGAGDDTIFGGAVNAIIEGGAGADTMDGGAGTNTVSYDGSDAGVYVNLTTNKVKGGDATGDTIANFRHATGSDFNDQLRGNSEDNRLTGGDGNDVLSGAGGGDNLIGGAGSDTVDYHYSNQGVTVDLSAQAKSSNGRAVLGEDAGGHASGDVISGIENVKGSSHDDVLIGSDDVSWNGKLLTSAENHLYGGKGDDYLEGKGGADTLSGGQGFDTASYASSEEGVTINLKSGTGSGGDAEGDTLSGIENVIGSDHDDTLIGNYINNTLEGGAGNDTLYVGFVKDFMDCGAGNDTAQYYGSFTGVTVNLAKGTAKYGDASGDTLLNIENLSGSSFNDKLIGDENDNILKGGKGNDILKGGAGSDTLDGGEGVDTVSYSDSDEGVSINLDRGTARHGDAVGDTLVSVENLTGSAHDDILVGNDSVNVLKAGAGNDRLKGYEGADTLDGGAGDDVLISENDGNILIGGEGADVFDLSRVKDLSGIATDIIKDFESGVDSIKLSQAHLGEDNVITAVATTLNGVEGLALTANVGNSTVNFAFLEGVSELSHDDFGGDFIPTIDVV